MRRASLGPSPAGDGRGVAAPLRCGADRRRRSARRRCSRPSRRSAAGAGCRGRSAPRALLDFVRFGLLDGAARSASEEFRGAGGARLLLAGNALHGDLGPESPGGAFFGSLLSLARAAGRLSGRPRAAPARAHRGARAPAASTRRPGAMCGERVAEIDRARRPRRSAVRHRPGTRDPRERAPCSPTSAAPQLYRDLLARAPPCPTASSRGAARFQYDNGTVKVDWALSGPVPWLRGDACARPARCTSPRASTSSPRRWREHRARARARAPVPDLRPVPAAPTHPPPVGLRAALRLPHVPHARATPRLDAWRGAWTERESESVRRPHGGPDRARSRPASATSERGRRVDHAARPARSGNANLVGGALGGGTTQLHQQLVFSPSPASPRRDVLAGLRLASSSHPDATSPAPAEPTPNARRAFPRRLPAAGAARRSASAMM